MFILRLVAFIRQLLLPFSVLLSFFRPWKRSRRAVAPLPPDDEVLRLSATALADRIRRRVLSSEQVVRAFIKRIQQVNRDLNAVVFDFFDDAVQEARQVDGLLDDGRAPSADEAPLLGVPFTVKECFAVRGAPNTSGLVRRRNEIAKETAPVVQRLCSAGGIVLAVTNVSELCLWFECYNRVYGRTCNPYDLSRHPGGSSGGEGAVAGAACSPFGIGSDIGGSIRMPCFFCGVFGHKPSAGLVPNDGQYPLAPNAKGRKMLATGPICRYAEDLEMLVKIMATEEEVKMDVPSPVDATPSTATVGDERVVTESWQVMGKEGFDSETKQTRPESMSVSSSWGVLSDAASTPVDQLSPKGEAPMIKAQRPDSGSESDARTPSEGEDFVVLGTWRLRHTAIVQSLCSSTAAPVALNTLRYVSIVDDRTGSPLLQSNLSKELKDIQIQVEGALERRHGVKVERARLSKLRCTADLWSIGMAELGGDDMAKLLYDLEKNGTGIWRSVSELCWWAVGRSKHTFIAIVTAFLDSSMSQHVPVASRQKSRQIRAALEGDLEELIGSNGVLLFPSHAVPVQKHNAALLTPMNFAYTALFNLSGMPVTQCPLGLDRDGLPLGIQVASLHGNDRLTLAVARDLEEAFGGWVPPQSA